MFCAAVTSLEEQIKRLEQRLSALEVTSGGAHAASPAKPVCRLLVFLRTGKQELFIGNGLGHCEGGCFRSKLFW